MNGVCSLLDVGCRAQIHGVTMIRAPNDIYGPNLFGIFVDELGLKQAVNLLGVHKRTVQRWKSGELAVPRMAVLALFWETNYGRSMIDTDQVNEIRLLYRRLHILEAQYAKARNIVSGIRRLQTGTANEAFFDELQDLNCQMPNTYGFDSPASPTPLQQDHVA